MGTTPRGLPYPEPTDPIAQGADAIRDLAVAVNQPISGRATIVGSGAVTAVANVTFPAGWFSANPRLVASVATSTVTFAVSTLVTSPTAGQIIGSRRDGATFTGTIVADWIAVA